MKKIFVSLSIFALAFSLLALFPAPVSAQQAEAPGEAIAAGQYTATCESDGDVLENLADQNRETVSKIYQDDALHIESPTAFSHVYILWQQPPGAWTLEGDGAAREYGQYGFIHEYIKLSSAQTQVTLTATQADPTICDIYLFSGSEVPDWVQVWQPPLAEADLLALPTHADDEHLFFGGTLPTYAGERGLKVQVVYLTNHWGEAYRPHELLNGLWTVGVTAYPVISQFNDMYADSLATAETLYDHQEILAFQVEMLRRFKPKVVVGHDIDGEYGHGVHILNAVTLLEALEMSPNAADFPESAELFGTWEVPKAYLHLWAENPITMDWDVPLERFGGATAFEMAVAGFDAHVSQQASFQVERGGPYDNTKFGLAHTTVGPDVAGGDFFENIDLAAALPASVAESQPEPQSAPASDTSLAASGSEYEIDTFFISEYDASAKNRLKDIDTTTILTVTGLIVFGLTVLVCLYLAFNRLRRKNRRPQSEAAQAKAPVPPKARADAPVPARRPAPPKPAPPEPTPPKPEAPGPDKTPYKAPKQTYKRK